MNREELYRITEDAVRDEELNSAEIPAIDLYVDQIINLVAEKLTHGSERYADRQLTKTMINNYSKDGLITPVKGKKYNKEQIIQILTIYTLKNTLSIGEIKRMLHGAYATEGFDGNALTDVYDGHLAIKRENRTYAQQILEALLEKYELDVENEHDRMLAISSLLSLSAFLRQMAQAVIDATYPPLEDEEEKKEKEKEEKKEDKREEKKEKKEEKEERKEKEKEEKKEEKKRKKAEKVNSEDAPQIPPESET